MNMFYEYVHETKRSKSRLCFYLDSCTGKDASWNRKVSPSRLWNCFMSCEKARILSDDRLHRYVNGYPVSTYSTGFLVIIRLETIISIKNWSCPLFRFELFLEYMSHWQNHNGVPWQSYKSLLNNRSCRLHKKYCSYWISTIVRNLCPHFRWRV